MFSTEQDCVGQGLIISDWNKPVTISALEDPGSSGSRHSHLGSDESSWVHSRLCWDRAGDVSNPL